ncbi:MAG: sporulation integral membrane protein YtvI [Eubacteriales bacterium]|nr:sporulation integral membrane protein YtvI [Eubacteriales bacterium]
MSIYNSRSLSRFKRIAEIILLLAVIPLGIYLAIKAGLFLAPFLIALIVSLILEPVISFLTSRIRLKRRLASLIALLLFLSTIGTLLTLLIMKLISEMKSLYSLLDQYYDTLNSKLSDIISQLSTIYSWLPEQVTANLGAIVTDASKFIIDIMNKLLRGVVTTAISMPQVLVFIIVTILSTYFLTGDREKIYDSIKKHIPHDWQAKILSLKNDMFSALFGYVKAQLILMTITFTELSIGFTILNIRQPILFALLISIFDALPIFGTGGILVPWSIYSFITGNITMGISVAVIYIVVLVVRQLIEPRVLGDQIGIHPLLTLLAMYVGLKLAGVPGLIIGPISILVFKNILSSFLKGRSFGELLGESSGSLISMASDFDDEKSSEPASPPDINVSETTGDDSEASSDKYRESVAEKPCDEGPNTPDDSRKNPNPKNNAGNK